MKKVIIFFIAVSLLVIPLVGCSESSPQAAADPLVTKSQLEQSVNNVNNNINSRINDVNKRIDGLPSSQFDSSKYYSKADVDRIINERIQAIKDDQAWITKKTTTTSTSSSSSTKYEGDEDNVLDTTEDLVLALERSIEDEFYLADNELSPYIKLSITNNDSTSHTFRLKADFDCEDTVKMQGATLTTDYSYNSNAVMVLDGNLEDVETSTIGFTSRRTIGSTDTTWYIGKDRTESIYLRFKPDYHVDDDADSHDWSWSFMLKQVD